MTDGEWTRVVIVRGWARGRTAWLCRETSYCIIKLIGEEDKYYYNPEDVRESDDELSDFVILTRTEKRSP